MLDFFQIGCYLIWLLFKPNPSEHLFKDSRQTGPKRVIGILLHSSHIGLNTGLIAAYGKKKQSITPGLGAGGLASIGEAAAKHHSPIICDSPQR